MRPAAPRRWSGRTSPSHPPSPARPWSATRRSGLNFIDVYFRTGLYKAPSLPAIIGMEGAGVVEAVGEGVTDVAVGDRVAYATGPIGAYAEARCIKADRLVKMPDGIGFEQAAAHDAAGHDRRTS